GRVVLAGCGSGGIGSKLLEMVSHAVLRTVKGFTEPILYAIDGTTKGPMVTDKTGKPIGRKIDQTARITVRGKVMYSRAANRVEDVLGADFVSTGMFNTNAWLLVPDAESNVGDVFRLVQRCKSRPDLVSTAELGYFLQREFYAYRTNVAGFGFADNLAGL